MTIDTTTCRWLTLAAYPLVGLALGLADPWLGQLVQQLGTKPGVATAVSVNVLLPFATVALALVHARLSWAWLGATVLTLGFVAGLAVRYAAGIPDWTLAGLLGSVPPVLIVAMLGYAILGSLAAWAVRASRRPAGLGEGG